MGSCKLAKSADQDIFFYITTSFEIILSTLESHVAVNHPDQAMEYLELLTHVVLSVDAVPGIVNTCGLVGGGLLSLETTEGIMV